MLSLGPAQVAVCSQNWPEKVSLHRHRAAMGSHIPRSEHRVRLQKDRALQLRSTEHDCVNDGTATPWLKHSDSGTMVESVRMAAPTGTREATHVYADGGECLQLV